MMIKQPEAILVVIAVFSLYLIDRHRDRNYIGPYRRDQQYDTISPMVDDTVKFSILTMMAHFLNGSPKPIYHPTNLLKSKVGDLLVIAASVAIYHQLIKPYLVVNLVARIAEPTDPTADEEELLEELTNVAEPVSQPRPHPPQQIAPPTVESIHPSQYSQPVHQPEPSHYSSMHSQMIARH